MSMIKTSRYGAISMSPTNSFPHRELGDLADTNSVIFSLFFLDLCYFYVY